MYGLQGLVLGLRTAVAGSSPFSGGAGCIPRSYHSPRVKGGARLYPTCSAVTLLGSCFPLQGVQLLDWTCKQGSVASRSGAG